jgi:hypothetical protein
VVQKVAAGQDSMVPEVEEDKESMVPEVEEDKESMGLLGSESAYGGSGRSSMVSTKNR